MINMHIVLYYKQKNYLSYYNAEKVNSFGTYTSHLCIYFNPTNVSIRLILLAIADPHGDLTFFPAPSGLSVQIC